MAKPTMFSQRQQRIIKDAILDGDIPNEHDAAFEYMLEKAEKMGLKRVK
jgi:poly(A) polymerase